MTKVRSCVRKKISGLVKGLRALTTDYGRMISGFVTLYCRNHNPKQIRSPLKCLQSLLFCRKYCCLMKNQGLGRYSDKMCAKSATENTSQFIWPTCPIGQIIWDMLEKGLTGRPWPRLSSNIWAEIRFDLTVTWSIKWLECLPNRYHLRIFHQLPHQTLGDLNGK